MRGRRPLTHFISGFGGRAQPGSRLVSFLHAHTRSVFRLCLARSSENSLVDLFHVLSAEPFLSVVQDKNEMKREDVRPREK